MIVEKYDRKAFKTGLETCMFADGKHDYIEITEWASGEGYDVFISSSRLEQTFQLTHGEFEALCALLKVAN